VAFDIAQFFLFLNYHLLPLILNKTEFNQKISTFFSNYLVNRKTKYLWNNFSSPLCDIDVGVGQGLALSPILSVLYPIFHIFENFLENLNISMSVLSFVDNEFFISQSKLLFIPNVNLFCSYNIILSLLTRFGLVIEHGKTKIFYFSQSYGAFNPPLLDLMSLSGHFASQAYLEISGLHLQLHAIVSSLY